MECPIHRTENEVFFFQNWLQGKTENTITHCHGGTQKGLQWEKEMEQEKWRMSGQDEPMKCKIKWKEFGWKDNMQQVRVLKLRMFLFVANSTFHTEMSISHIIEYIPKQICTLWKTDGKLLLFWGRGVEFLVHGETENITQQGSCTFTEREVLL